MIVVDVETTGTNPNKNSIVSIGAVEFENPTNRFYEECKIPNDAEVEPEAMAVNGFSYDQITDPTKKTLENIIQDFINWSSGFKNKTLVAHNASFDIGFLKASASKYNIYWAFSYIALDTHTMAYIDIFKKDPNSQLIYGSSSLSLNKTLEYVGLPKEPNPHNALTGAIHETETMYRLILGINGLEEFKSYPIPTHLAKIKQASLF